MDYSELIYDYLDGELNPTLEDKLFAEMSVNQDLRSDFAKQIKINNFALEDMNAMQIPSETTAAIFSNLGFSIPASSVPTSTFAYYFSWLKNNKLRKASIAMLLLFIGFGAGWMLNNVSDNSIQNNTQFQFAKLGNSSQQQSSDEKIDPNNSTGVLLSHNLAKASFPIASSIEDKKENRHTNNNKIGNDRAYSQKYDNSISQGKAKQLNTIENNTDKPIYESRILASNEQNNPAVNDVSGGNSSFAALSPAFQSNRESDYSSMPFSSFNKPISSMNFNSSPIESHFEAVVNTRAFRISKELSQPDDKSFFSGSSVSILYKINDEHYLGGDFGEDEFYQQFMYNNGEQLIEYQQAPNYYWGAVSYKYLPQYLNLFDAAQVYAKASIGGCKAGAIGKMQMGISYKLTPSLNAFVGGEFSTLLFNIRNDFYYSKKFEVLYGISLNL